MAKINKEVVDCLENDAWVATWDKGENEIDPDCKVVRCKDCRFGHWGYQLKQNEVCCNKSGLIMNANSSEYRQITRKNRGFCGYDWMVDPIISNNEIK